MRCARGAILDVVVDLRRDSPTFGGWEGIELDDETMRQLLRADRVRATGSACTERGRDVVYKCSSYYDAATEAGIAYDDPASASPGRYRRADRLRARPQRASLADIAESLTFLNQKA